MSQVRNGAIAADLYRDGVAAIVQITSGFTSEDWKRPACGTWTAEETVRHLVGVVGWYDHWLDRAIAGQATPPFDESEFDVRNAQRIEDLGQMSGSAAVAKFERDATNYLVRASSDLPRPYGFPAGIITVALHLGIAATEWHLHAWDLTVGQDERHEPDRASALFTAAGAAMARAKGGVVGGLLRVAVPVVAKRSPWKTLLKQSGRSTA